MHEFYCGLSAADVCVLLSYVWLIMLTRIVPIPILISSLLSPQTSCFSPSTTLSRRCLGYPTWEMDPCYFTQPLETPAVPPRLTS